MIENNHGPLNFMISYTHLHDREEDIKHTLIHNFTLFSSIGENLQIILRSEETEFLSLSLFSYNRLFLLDGK